LFLHLPNTTGTPNTIIENIDDGKKPKSKTKSLASLLSPENERR